MGNIDPVRILKIKVGKVDKITLYYTGSIGFWYNVENF
jgi:ABC-type transporter Mla subunit MlaD